MNEIICNISDSFVAIPQKLKGTRGSGERWLYIAQEKEIDQIKEFFSDFRESNEYFFSKNNLEQYMQDTQHEYKHQKQIYLDSRSNTNTRGYRKNIFLDYHSNCQKIKDLNTYWVFKNLEERVDGGRFYIKPKELNEKEPAWTFVRNILLPVISKIHILKKPDGDRYRYEFKLYFNYKDHYELLNPNNINFINYIEEEIKKKHGVNNLASKRLIEARNGQGYFRKQLFQRTNCCLITGISNPVYLEAAHIKPWSRSNDDEKLDSKNGIFLTPNCHQLFDNGIITFTKEGKLIKSDRIKKNILDILLIENKKVDRSILLDVKTTEYMNWHKENIYEKL